MKGMGSNINCLFSGFLIAHGFVFCPGEAAWGQSWSTGFLNTVLLSSVDPWPLESGNSYWIWELCHQVSVPYFEDTITTLLNC